MKSKSLIVLAFGLTLGAVLLYPGLAHIEAALAKSQPKVAKTATDAPVVEAVFVLDTTGSMGGLIQAAKDKIWSIATSMASAQSQPTIRLGLVAYRDRGDDYVTQVVDLSEDLDSIYATLVDFQAAGGGDGPESVNQALHDAIHKVSWSQNTDNYRVVFLVGDAPPHMDYADDTKYPEILKTAAAKGIVVNAIQCGQNDSARQVWQQVAQLGYGEYFQVAQDGNAVAIKTPYDAKLAELSASLDATRLYYGTSEQKAKKAEKLEATRKLQAKASTASLARRAEFNASASGKSNSIGEGDLVEEVTSGRVDLKEIDRKHLPDAVKPLSPEARKALIGRTAERRRQIKQEIRTLAAQRGKFLEKRLEERADDSTSLDQQLYDVVKQQAAKKGFEYASEAPAY